MDGWIAAAVDFLNANRAWAGPIVGLLAFAESLAVIGMLVPATALMIAVGGMMGMGYISPLPVVAWTIVGAVLGDWISYAVGWRIGHSAFHRWPLNRHKQAVARTRLFFRRYGFLTILFGRFLGPIRATVPLVAGVMKMSNRRFQTANILSAVIWAPALYLPGYLAARSLGLSAQISEAHILGLGVLALVLTFAGTEIVRRILSRKRPRRKPGVSLG